MTIYIPASSVQIGIDQWHVCAMLTGAIPINDGDRQVPNAPTPTRQSAIGGSGFVHGCI